MTREPALMGADALNYLLDGIGRDASPRQRQ
jgi:hypothetical protein